MLWLFIMADKEKKDGLMKKFGKSALKAGSDSTKGAIKGTIAGAAVGAVKEGIKQATDASGINKAAEDTKGGLQDQLKKKENEVKKKIVKEAIKQSFK